MGGGFRDLKCLEATVVMILDGRLELWSLRFVSFRMEIMLFATGTGPRYNHWTSFQIHR